MELKCMSCGGSDFEILEDEFLTEHEDYGELYLKGKASICKECGDALMTTEQMQDFLKAYKEKVNER